MSDVTFGDILFILIIFGIIYTCLHLANRSKKADRENKEGGDA